MRTRRGVLAILAIGTGSITGCTAKYAQSHSSDNTLRVRAAGSARALADLYETALRESARTSGCVDNAVATLYRSHHVAHVRRLTNGSGGTTPVAIAPATNTSPTSPASLACDHLASDERAAVGTGPTDVSRASGDLAALLASIGACRALHAQSLDPSKDTGSADAPTLATTKPSASGGLQALLSAEYAMVFAYGALGPHLTGSQSAQAHAAFDLHRGQRDVLVAAIGARGGSPLAAEASYDLPFHVTDATSALRLAALVENRLTAVSAQSISVSSSGDRAYAAWALTQAALRAQTWGAPVTAFPGLDA